MGDNYRVGQGAAGPGAVASGNTFLQLWVEKANDIDLHQLRQELIDLRIAAKEASSGDAEQDLAIGALAGAEKAAAEANGPKVLEYLRQAGKWVLDLAESIGAPLATKALQAALGIPG